LEQARFLFFYADISGLFGAGGGKMTRKDYVFCIGYEAETAIIDKRAQGRFAGLDTDALIQKGLFRYAAASAEFSGNADEQKAVIEGYNKMTRSALTDFQMVRRLFGLNPASKKAVKIKLLG
jgi:hypothetical protein